MKKTLLFLALSAMCLTSTAKQIDQWTIYYPDEEMYAAETNPEGWNPNGTVPPQPEADYYLDLSSRNNVYYRFEAVEGSSPLYYEAHISVLGGDFKVYAKGYWSDRNTSDYGNGDKYIYGAADGAGSGVTQDVAKNLSNPGSNLQLEGGGTIYGCVAKFYPTGESGSGTPQLIVTGGSTVEQSISLTATATLTNDNMADVSFTIGAAGVVKPSEQTYTVTISYVNSDGQTVENSTKVTGLTGSFTDLEGISEEPGTEFLLTVSISQAPVYSDASTPEVISGYKDLTASTTTSIQAPGLVYLVGNISGSSWNPEAAIEGQKLSELNPGADGGNYIRVWHNVELTDQYRFRFTSRQASWNSLNADGTQYYPSSETLYCDNMYETSTAWYASTAGKETNNAYAPSSARERGTTTDNKFDIYFDTRNNQVAIGWGTPTEVQSITDTEDAVPVDVFTLTGVCVRQGVDRTSATDGLPAGLYLIGDKKVLVK